MVSHVGASKIVAFGGCGVKKWEGKNDNLKEVFIYF
jgi:hypothetical protein